MNNKIVGLIAILLLSMPAYAKGKKKNGAKKQTVIFNNIDSEKLDLTIYNQKSGAVITTKTLRPKETFAFNLDNSVEYAVRAKEVGGKMLDSGIYNLFLRERFSEGEVTIQQTKPFLKIEKTLTFSGKRNAVVRQPILKPEWQHDQLKVAKQV